MKELRATRRSDFSFTDALPAKPKESDRTENVTSSADSEQTQESYNSAEERPKSSHTRNSSLQNSTQPMQTVRADATQTNASSGNSTESGNSTFENSTEAEAALEVRNTTQPVAATQIDGTTQAANSTQPGGGTTAGSDARNLVSTQAPPGVVEFIYIHHSDNVTGKTHKITNATAISAETGGPDSTTSAPRESVVSSATLTVSASSNDSSRSTLDPKYTTRSHTNSSAGSSENEAFKEIHATETIQPDISRPLGSGVFAETGASNSTGLLGTFISLSDNAHLSDNSASWPARPEPDFGDRGQGVVGNSPGAGEDDDLSPQRATRPAVTRNVPAPPLPTANTGGPKSPGKGAASSKRDGNPCLRISRRKISQQKLVLWNCSKKQTNLVRI